MAKYPRVVIETSKEDFLNWLEELRQAGRFKTATILQQLWSEKIDEWKQGKWGNPKWTQEEAESRAAAWARGHYHYSKGRKKREEMWKELEEKYRVNSEKYKKVESNTQKRREFIDTIQNEEEKAAFSAYRHAGLVEARGMDLKKFANRGALPDPGPKPPDPVPEKGDIIITMPDYAMVRICTPIKVRVNVLPKRKFFNQSVYLAIKQSNPYLESWFGFGDHYEADKTVIQTTVPSSTYLNIHALEGIPKGLHDIIVEATSENGAFLARASIRIDFEKIEPHPAPPEPVDGYVLHCTVHPQGAGSITPHGDTTHRPGNTVWVTARAHEGFEFIEWIIDGNSFTASAPPDMIISPNGGQLNMTMDSDHTVMAVFRKVAAPPGPPQTGRKTVVVTNESKASGSIRIYLDMGPDSQQSDHFNIGPGGHVTYTFDNIPIDVPFVVRVIASSPLQPQPSFINEILTEKEKHKINRFKLISTEKEYIKTVIVKNNTKNDVKGVQIHCSPAPILVDGDTDLGDMPPGSEDGCELHLEPGRIYEIKVTSGTHNAIPSAKKVKLTQRHPTETNNFEFGEEGKKGRELHWREAYAHWNIRNYMPTIALISIGFAAAFYTGNYWFMLAFLSWATIYIFPNPATYWQARNIPELAGMLQQADLDNPMYRGPEGAFNNAARREALGQELRNMRAMVQALYSNVPGRHHVRMGFIRSFFRAQTTVLFYWAFIGGPLFGKSDIPFFNLFAIAALFIGYWTMAGQYHAGDNAVPGEFIEAFFRWLIGLTFIPFALLYMFDSWVLFFIALAFFSVPPLMSRAREVGEAERLELFETPLKTIFAILMLIALIGSGSITGFYLIAVIIGIAFLCFLEKNEMCGFILIGAAALLFIAGAGLNILSFAGSVGWQLTGLLQVIFIYFWFVTFIGGFFSPSEVRPEMGMLMLGAAMAIYTIGPGTQEVGGALLGDWFPSVYTTFSNVFKPLTELFAGLGGTFGTSWKLLTNPVGYAQDMMTGTYAKDPNTGIAGAFGVEIEDLRISPLYVCRPYTVTAKLNNRGAFDAKNVRLILSSPLKLTMAELGFKNQGSVICDDSKTGLWSGREKAGSYCWQPMGGTENKLQKRESRELSFIAGDMINCQTVINTNLRKKFIPMNVSVVYDYQIDSNFEVEFINKAEWQRRIDTGNLGSVRKMPSSFTNAPVRLNLDTQEQPITESTPFSLNIALQNAQGGKGGITDLGQGGIVVELPEGFPTPDNDKCVSNLDCAVADRKITCTKKGSMPVADIYVASCFFSSGFGFKDSSPSPTKTFLIKAHADYTFEQTISRDTKLEFGSIRCCEKDKDCALTAEEVVMAGTCKQDTKSCGGMGCVVAGTAGAGTTAGVYTPAEAIKVIEKPKELYTFEWGKIAEISDLSERIRILEERVAELERKISALEIEFAKMEKIIAVLKAGTPEEIARAKTDISSYISKLKIVKADTLDKLTIIRSTKAEAGFPADLKARADKIERDITSFISAIERAETMLKQMYDELITP